MPTPSPHARPPAETATARAFKLATPGPTLAPFDVLILRDRGVSLDTARRNRLRTAGGALIIPFADLAGQYDGYALRRPHHPPVIGGKPRKYVAPAGLPSRAYFPAECVSGLADPAVPLVVTEGPLKALVLAQHGHTAVGLLGVWNWKRKGTDELIADLAALPWAGRTVYVAFDYDPKPATRTHVLGAAARLAAALRKAGAG